MISGSAATVAAALAAVWIVIAAALSIAAARRLRRAGAVLGSAQALSRLLEVAPARPLVVHADGHVEADPRLLRELGLSGSPASLADLAGDECGFDKEDLDALIAAAGGRASLFGISSGGLLALEAAAHALPVERVVSYEAPLLLDAARRPSLALALALEAPTAAGRRADAAELFLTRVVGMPPAVVGAMKQAPHWHGLEMLAHTLSHDVRITAAAPQLLARLPSVSTPVFVLDGSASPPWLRGGGIALARAAPNGRHRTLEGQTHDVQPVALAAALRELLTEETPHGAPELSPGGSRAAKPGNVG